MSTRSTSSKSKPAAKSKAKTTAKPKSRLAGPKPPKSRGAAKSTKTVSNAATEPKPSAPKAAPARPGRIPPPPGAVPAAMPAPSQADVLKKRELIEQIVERSGVKKKFAKPVMEAMLEVMGEAVAKGRDMTLPPMGRIKYNRTKETPAARVVITKIRQNKGGKIVDTPAKETVAEPAE